MNIDKVKSIYFLGIGGIGMSALARYFNNCGVDVIGYDKTSTELTKTLEGEGISIHYKDEVELIPNNIDIVIYTPAIPESLRIKQRLLNDGHQLFKRSEILGQLSNTKSCIAVAGTHGKTSTSSIVSFLLDDLGVNPTAFVGGIMKDVQSNFIQGKSDWIVVEADEYDRSFLQLRPRIAIILSMDPDHLDIYGSHEDMIGGFRDFTLRIVQGGTLILHQDLMKSIDMEWYQKLIRNDVVVLTFGDTGSDYRIQNVRVEEGCFHFDLNDEADFNIQLPGRHNVENATAAIAVCDCLDIKFENIRRSLSKFNGIKRRFETVLKTDDYVLIDDYAHHPTELTVAIAAARELYPNQKITGIFQPHLFTRTRDFAEGFAKALDGLDRALIMEIYPAREEPIVGVDSNMVLKKMNSDNKELVIRENLISQLSGQEVEVILVLGAGDIDREVEKVRQFLLTK